MELLCRATENEKKKLNIENEDVYIYKKDELVLGYAIIDEDQHNSIYIYIMGKYRGNGYGNNIFSLVLLELKKLGLYKITITIEKNNYIMIRIIEKNNGVLITQDENTETFAIPIE